MLKELKLGEKTEDGKEKVIISVGPVKSDISCSPETLEAVRDVFSYYVEDADYIRSNNMKKYQRLGRRKDVEYWAKWDGHFSAFYGTTFGTGLVQDVMMWVIDQGHELEIFDHRKEPLPDTKFEKDEDEWKTLYDKQKEAFESLKANNFSGIAWASTSFGKTVLGTHIMEELMVPTVIIGQTRKVIQRWRQEIKMVFSNIIEEKLDGVTGYVYYVNDAPMIMVCTTKLIISAFKGRAKSMDKRNDLVKWMSKNSGLLIFDEVHRAGAKEAGKAVRRVTAYHRIGLSGTVHMRSDNADMKYIADIAPVVFHYSPSELVEDEKGSVINIEPIPLVYDPSFFEAVQNLDDWNDLYMEYIQENETRNRKIVSKTLLEVSNGKSVLILVDRIDHAMKLKTMLGDKIAVYTSSNDKDTEEKFDRFTNEEIPVMICTASMASEGFDFPNLRVLFIVSGRSEIKIRQSLGRPMREKDYENEATVYDFADPIYPFKKHFLERLEIYKSEDAYVINEDNLPRWAIMHV